MTMVILDWGKSNDAADNDVKDEVFSACMGYQGFGVNNLPLFEQICNADSSDAKTRERKSIWKDKTKQNKTNENKKTKTKKDKKKKKRKTYFCDPVSHGSV